MKSERVVIERIRQALDRPVEVRGGGILEKEVVKAFGNEAPTPNQRIAKITPYRPRRSRFGTLGRKRPGPPRRSEKREEFFFTS